MHPSLTSFYLIFASEIENKCNSKTQYPPYGGEQISDLGDPLGHPSKGGLCPKKNETGVILNVLYSC